MSVVSLNLYQRHDTQLYGPLLAKIHCFLSTYHELFSAALDGEDSPNNQSESSCCSRQQNSSFLEKSSPEKKSQKNDVFAWL